MAFLKNSVVAGDLRVTGTIFGDANLSSINANNTGLGTDGQILTSTGTGIAWSSSVAPSSHSHAADDITSGILAIARGGTGLSASPSMLTNLGSTTAANVLQASPRPGVTGTLGAANGGTGKTTLKDSANALINALDTGSSNLTANDYVITQYVGGGTTTTTYHRRPASAIRVGGLLTARKLKVALGSTTDVTFDGTADQTSIPISGTLGIANGGTGATTATDAWTALGGGASGKHADSYFALASHGNHVPAAQTANNAIFLRNDNTWQTVTPANIGAAASDHNHDGTYLKLSGGTMTGGITFPGDSSAWNTKGILFSKGSRIGEDPNATLGIYGTKIVLRPNSTTSNSSDGVEISGNGLYPTNNNSETLGDSSHKWSNVYATTFTGDLNGISNGGIYLTSGTAAATAAKTADCTGFTLLTGSSIYINFAATNTKDAPTLNVNSTGAKSIYHKGVQVTYQGLAAGILYHMIYDGTNWQIVNNITPQMGTCSTNIGSPAKTVTCPGFIPYTGAIVYIKFNSNNTARIPTLNINGYGAKPIRNKGATTGTFYYIFRANQYYKFVYTGDEYEIVNHVAQVNVTPGVTAQDAVTDPDTGDIITPAVTQVHGTDVLYLGNSTSSTTDGGLTGVLGLYNAGTKYIYISAELNTAGSNRIWYLPNLNSNRYFITHSAASALGTNTKPIKILENGAVAETSEYAGGTAVTLNGTSKSASTASFYAPTDAGTTNQVLTSSGGTSAPTWKTLSTTSIGSASAGTAIDADDITSWSAGTAASASYANGILVISDGTVPTLDYSSKTIPNISVDPVTVATGSLS